MRNWRRSAAARSAPACERRAGSRGRTRPCRRRCRTRRTRYLMQVFARFLGGSSGANRQQHCIARREGEHWCVVGRSSGQRQYQEQTCGHEPSCCHHPKPSRVRPVHAPVKPPLGQSLRRHDGLPHLYFVLAILGQQRGESCDECHSRHAAAKDELITKLKAMPERCRNPTVVVAQAAEPYLVDCREYRAGC